MLVLLSNTSSATVNFSSPAPLEVPLSLWGSEFGIFSNATPIEMESMVDVFGSGAGIIWNATPLTFLTTVNKSGANTIIDNSSPIEIPLNVMTSN